MTGDPGRETRTGQIFIEGGVYHVYNRVYRGEAVFGEGNEAARFAEVLRQVSRRDELTVFAWVLMGTHS